MITFKYRGITFGGRTGDIIVTGFDQGSLTARGTDTARSQRDGTTPGRTFYEGRTWAIDMATNGRDLDETLALSGALEAAWMDPAVRLRPNHLEPLSYLLNGRWRRVYGRPGPFAPPELSVVAGLGAGKITADFQVMDIPHYDDAESVVDLTIVPATTGGLVSPLVAPLTSVRSSTPRAGFVTNLGNQPTPLKAIFYGPVTDPFVRAAAGWEIALTGTLAHDQSVTVDALHGTVTRNDGAPVAGMLTRATRLTSAKLPVGQSELTFGGQDTSGTARVQLRWRNAHTSI